jgi:alpha-L-rhamnosidase
LYIARLAEALGRQPEARRFSGYAAEIRGAVQRHLWNDRKGAYVDGLYADGSQSQSTSQQANMVPLVLRFADARQTPGAMAAVKEAGYATAPMLVRFLVQAYGEYGQHEALLKYLTDPEGHNWAYIIADDGSFTYENWRGRKRKGGGADSESHPVGAYGGVIALQHYILGVQPLAPQYARVQIRPCPAQLQYAKGTIPTQRGPIYVAWENHSQAAGFSLTVRLPCNVKADVHVPRGRADGTTVTVNGKRREGKVSGEYLVISDVGSGEHVFARP